MTLKEQEDKAFNQFFENLEYYADLIKNKNNLEKSEKEKLKEFKKLRDAAEFIGREKGITGDDYLQWICHIYIRRIVDKNVDEWSFIDSFRNTILFDIEELYEIHDSISDSKIKKKDLKKLNRLLRESNIDQVKKS